MPPSTRSITMSYHFEMGSVATLTPRMMALWRKNGKVLLGEVVDRILTDAQAQLFKPADFPDTKHGFDTGLLHDTLVKVFMEMIVDGCFYELKSDQAYYWMWVNFGHFTTAGNWWEGYHFFETAIEQHAQDIANCAREAWILAAREASLTSRFTPGGLGSFVQTIEGI